MCAYVVRWLPLKVSQGAAVALHSVFELHLPVSVRNSIVFGKFA